MHLKSNFKNINIIIALDFFDENKAMKFIYNLNPTIYALKIGNIMFTLFGVRFIKILQKLGFKIFLDLKFYDIPNTIFGAIQAVANLNIWMVSIHISGGIQMLKSARLALKPFKNKPLLMGVTILTSLDKTDMSKLGIQISLSKYILSLAKIAHKCNLDGIICSGTEISNIKKHINVKNFKILTPGIRLNGCSSNDQKNVTTPMLAKQYNVDYIIIGRIVTSSQNPLKTLELIRSQI
ncbi:orotidine 5'-phosphate decarboxylase [Buchnera aphidicola str. Bp (Baizongia pistaciae)]|uniref:Orotidine 5'-phosphate decarboxylase n=1 Tax=Buchnera aphidicola subsp. Baizongia pistaciae (strain Bp) TaxID=224915 RepID=PYRF_BUCBP|nr:orotidine-5'-phosphate decarboxylase [Buchnera aphidicola]Q89AL6.1 RecName: Full=Orotidine 5'-phosphate decarboxylase; AltName: Full=OMP decarboxylase; Short=OMPDCase; Short=OMPdecase [Buchnera aphidicola str. Bp (Baizongia pistaciae)]AAO26978.1 orotidine 5'-phosphate decarboxylase [Buchnera aphidicola str. Bp (Baizongia pistaciae)]